MGIINHRKLVSSAPETVGFEMADLCTTVCDLANTTSGLCPELCFANCPKSCLNIPPPDVTTAHHKSQKLPESLIICLSLIGLACLIFCLFTVFRYIRNKRRRPLQQQQEQPPQIHVHDHFLDGEQGPIIDHPIWYIRTVGLPSSTIDSITVIRYKRGEGLVEGTDCSVCLSEFEDDETLRLLPKCNHAFHVPCIDTWLRSHTNCPMCRAPIVSTPNGTLSPVLERRLEEDSRRVEVVTEGSEERERENLGLEPKDVGPSQPGRGNIGNADTGGISLQPIRRSVSMDSLAASRLSADIITAGEVAKKVDLNQGLMRFVGGSSFRKSLPKGPVWMKRSYSCSGNVLPQTRNLKHSQ